MTPMTKLVGAVLQLLSAASIVAAFVLLLFQFLSPKEKATTLQGNDIQANNNLRTLGWAAAAALGSRVALAGLAYLALAGIHAFGSPDLNALIIQSDKSFAKTFPPLSSLFNRWDGPHYLDIARLGYTADKSLGDQWLFIVFYPLYPALTALLKPLFGTVFSAATAVSWGCLAGACYFIYKLAKLDVDYREARRAVKFLLIFPAAVFLGAPYTESLFLLLTALCLYSLRKGNFWLAGVAGFFAALTRNLGVLLAVPFLIELLDRLGLFADWSLLRSGRFWLKFLKHGVWILLLPLGECVYLMINKIVYGDPFMFLQIQSEHWGQQMQPFWLTVQSTWTSLTGNRPVDEKIYLWAPQLAAMAAMLIALPFMLKKLRLSYAAYLLVYVVVALSPSWLLSFSRYMMGAVPLFIGLAAMTKKKSADIVLTVVFAAVMLFLAAGYFMWKMVV